jgi:hypothetical protein
MGVCAFVARGVNFDVDDYLQVHPFNLLCVFHKGDARPFDNPGNEPRPDSGFVAVVSHDDLPHLLDQVEEALDFLEMNEQELERLKRLGADMMALDFRVLQSDGPQNTHQISSELIATMSRWDMELVFSVITDERVDRPFRRRFRRR